MTNQGTITREARPVEGVVSPQPTIPMWVLAVGLVVVVAISAIVAVNVMSEDGESLTRSQVADQARWQGWADHYATADLTPVQQAEADRLAGLAEYYGIAPQSLTPAQQAEADRLAGQAEYYGIAPQSLTPAQQAEADRLQGLADHHATQDLTRAQQAEADRLQGLADSFGN